MKNHTLVVFSLSLVCGLLLFQAYPVNEVSKTANITVTATLLPTCLTRFLVSGSTSFGTLDFGSTVALTQPISVAGQTNSGAITVQCSNGTSFNVLLSSGQSGNTNNRYLSGGPSAQQVSYNLYTNATYSVIWDDVVGVSQVATGQVVTIPVYGLVPAQSTPAVGTYTDTVQVTVSW
ncbi:Csu type fimbrial protein [Yersinia pseudotuberculosis]|uniref:Csu type fimbrial protein n=1 Tax=Yersinia pseudotuberculosis TaxID=633 RepID=UPI000D0BAB80|nr:spore coat U domain-containing protein [Yersinia pseudotuberculosis]